MTGKAIVNLIRKLRKAGMSDTKMLDLIEYMKHMIQKNKKQLNK